MKRKQQSEGPKSDDELDFLASQQSESTGSDDQALEMAIASHYAALREKKRKEKEQKFLKAVYKQLSEDVKHPADQLKSSAATLESLFADFLLKYAAAEDTIRSLWSQIEKEQMKLLVFTQQRHAANVEAGKDIEEKHISGLSLTKAACHDFERVIKQIAPRGS